MNIYANISTRALSANDIYGSNCQEPDMKIGNTFILTNNGKYSYLYFEKYRNKQDFVLTYNVEIQRKIHENNK